MPECPIPLLGRDLLGKLDAQITFWGGEIQIQTPESKIVEAKIFMLPESNEWEEIPKEVESAVTPLVWATEMPG